MTLTVQGLCAQCWGMKSDRPFPWKRGRRDQGTPSLIDDLAGDLVDDFILWGCCWWPALTSIAAVLIIVLVVW